MSKELEAFRKICKNLNSYEFTDEYKKNKKLIETALKNHEELTSKPVILYGRTHGHTQAIIDTICKNYKEVKITNLEDEEKVKALEIIKEKLFYIDFKSLIASPDYEAYCFIVMNKNISKEEYDLLKEVLL